MHVFISLYVSPELTASIYPTNDIAVSKEPCDERCQASYFVCEASEEKRKLYFLCAVCPLFLVRSTHQDESNLSPNKKSNLIEINNLCHRSPVNEYIRNTHQLLASYLGYITVAITANFSMIEDGNC